MAVYIRGMGSISPQDTSGENVLLSQARKVEGDRLSCLEPDYSRFVDIRQLRRMSRILKMGVAAGSMALKEAGINIPDGIITGTGYGCLEDTGTFLTKMIENDERALNPTPFIQSTHNTIGSQIALLLACQGYNQTYTQRAFSFENALLDAILELTENPGQALLVGGVDEVTNVSHSIQQRFGIFRHPPTRSPSPFQEKIDGTINGEGASYFVLSGHRTADDRVCLDSTAMFYKPTEETLITGIERFLDAASLKAGDIDLVLLGKSGDSSLDTATERLSSKMFESSSLGRFKHLCGEYPTASGFATFLAARIIQRQMIPADVVEHNKNRQPKCVLIYNPYFGSYHSLILLRHVEF